MLAARARWLPVMMVFGLIISGYTTGKSSEAHPKSSELSTTASQTESLSGTQIDSGETREPVADSLDIGREDVVPPYQLDVPWTVSTETSQTSLAVRWEQLPRFGLRIFRESREEQEVTSALEAIYNIPAAPEYVLARGDILTVRCWRGVRENVNETLTVTAEGSTYLPLLGEVVVTGQTLERAREFIMAAYTKLYTDAQVSVTVSQARTGEVYIAGEVQWPGKYALPGSATVLSALYAAGGPSDIGSLRHIRILKHARPSNQDAQQDIDLYDYLVYGRPLAAMSVESDDTIFLPPVAAQVGISGHVLRPGRYELRPDEKLGDLLNTCGNLAATGDPSAIHIWRKTSRGRKLLSADGDHLQQGEIALQPGDPVEVLEAPEGPVNTVEIMGAVRRPGVYPHIVGERLSDLLKKAGGLDDTAYTERAKLLRGDAGLHYEIIYVALTQAMTGSGEEDLSLQVYDKVVVYSQPEMEPPAEVIVRGPVLRPGAYEWTLGMKVSDLLLQAGGLAPEAYGLRARVLRRGPANKQHLLTITLDQVTREDAQADITLECGDTLEILVAAEVTTPSEARISGYVNNPGTHRRYEGMRVSDLILSAGGLTPGAGPGAQCVRGRFEGKVKIIQLHLDKDPNTEEFSVHPDLMINKDDHIAILGSGAFVRHPPVVIVAGEIKLPGAYVLDRGRKANGTSLWTILQKAGGLLETASPRGIVVYRVQEKFFPPSQPPEAMAELRQVLDTFNREREEQFLERARCGMLVQGQISRALANIVSSDDGAMVVVPPRLLSQDVWAQAIPIDGEGVVASEGQESDIELMDGDYIVVPRRSSTVGIVGAVVRSGAIPYEGAYSPRRYVELAGGAAEDANLARMVVIRANTRVVPGRLVREVYPGDVIVVPSDFLVRRVRSGRGYQQVVRNLVGLATALLIF